MRKRRIPGRMIMVLVALTFLGAACTAYAEGGILPSLTGSNGISMPSLGEALKRYPDSETKNEDGSVTYLYTIIKEEDYNTFSNYLAAQGAELGDYRMEGGVITAELRVNDASFSFVYDTGNGDMKVTYPQGTYDAWAQNARKHYSYALKLLEKGSAEEAFAEIRGIPRYRDYAPVIALLRDNPDLADAAAVLEEKAVPFREVGNTVIYGRYEQDSATEGSEPIEWIVLDYDAKADKALLISRYCLATRTFSDQEGKDTTWETCTLRQWLNTEFLSEAFTPEEQKAILATEVDNSASQGCSEWNQGGSNNTQDQLFLLSYGEANRYYGVTLGLAAEAPRCALTPSAASTDGGRENIEMGENEQTTDAEPAAKWWLRSLGEHGDSWWTAMNVASNGMPAQDGMRNYAIAVRPAFWLDLDSLS